MLHHSNNHKEHLKKETIRLFKESKEYWNYHNDKDDIEWVPLANPFQSGYYFTLSLVEDKLRTLPEEKEALLREIYPYVVTEFVSMEKRPYWKKTWNVVDDIIVTYNKKKEKEISHFFNWISAYKNEDGVVRPHLFYKNKDKDFFNSKLFPFLTLETWTAKDWTGKNHTHYAYVLDKKWRKYFQFRRCERWITHKAVKDGTLDSRKHWLNNKLYNRDMMWYKYYERPSYDGSSHYEGQEKKEKVLKNEFFKEIKYLE